MKNIQGPFIETSFRKSFGSPYCHSVQPINFVFNFFFMRNHLTIRQASITRRHPRTLLVSTVYPLLGLGDGVRRLGEGRLRGRRLMRRAGLARVGGVP